MCVCVWSVCVCVCVCVRVCVIIHANVFLHCLNLQGGGACAAVLSVKMGCRFLVVLQLNCSAYNVLVSYPYEQLWLAFGYISISFNAGLHLDTYQFLPSFV